MYCVVCMYTCRMEWVCSVYVCILCACLYYHTSAAVERDAAAKRIVELEKEVAGLKTEMSKVSVHL